MSVNSLFTNNIPSSASSEGTASTDELYAEISPDLFVDTGDDSHDTFRSCTPGAKKSLLSPRLSATLSGRPAVISRQRTYSASGTKNQTVLRTQQRNIYIAGRPPWYDAHGQHFVESFVIGICGGSASGKTTVAQKIIEALDVPWVTLLSMDSFYKVLNEEEHIAAHNNEYNFDHPDAFDFQLLIETLQKLKEGKCVEVPSYNFVTHARDKRTKKMYGANVIICEGILLFANKHLVDMLDMKIFIDTDSDIRLARRLKRDISERGRELVGVLKQYNRFVKPSFEYYIAPSVTHADLIVPRGGDNQVAINLIVQHVHTQLQARGVKLRSKLMKVHLDQPLPKSLIVLPETRQIKGIHTIIRDRDTSRDEFIFYSKRLIRLLIEFALTLLPFSDHAIDTPQGVPYHGRKMMAEKMCGVSILRAGETMEQALCDVLNNVRLGKILIQTNNETDEPELYYCRLPKDIKSYRVILMDATVASGAAAMMAIRVLLDHDVPEENILLCSLLMAESGVHTIAYAFPKVQIVTTAVDPEVNEKFYILPGIGNFGDRFYGTENTRARLVRSLTAEMAYCMRLYKPRAILVQVLGVLTSEKWKQDVIVPYVRENYENFLARNKTNPDVLILIEALRAMARKYEEDDASVPMIEEDTANADDVVKSTVNYLNWQASHGRSNEPTHALEGLVRRDGYERDQLKTQLYDDVVPALKAWNEQGIRIYLDTPTLSQQDTNLIMQKTNAGDIRSMFKGCFGNETKYLKTNSDESYKNIFTALKTPFEDILFVTHLGQRAKQINDKFGVECLMIDRSENRKIRSYYLVRFTNVMELNEVEFVKRGK